MKIENYVELTSKIFELVDLDGSGMLEFTEWCLLSLNWNEVLTKEKIKSCFNLIDKDYGGYLSFDELRFIFSDTDKEYSDEFF